MTVKRGRNAVRVLAPVTLVILAVALAVPSAFAVPGTAVATVTPSTAPVPAGATELYSFALTPTSGQIGSFNLSAPPGWALSSLTAPSGVTLVSATQIQGRGLTITSSSPLSISFTGQAPCTSSSSSWSLAAKSGSNFTGNSFSIDASSSLSTPLAPSCTAAFLTGRGPADAAFNGGSKSQNITSVPYTPDGAAIQVAVADATGAPRAGISITLSLTSPAGTNATLSGPLTATSGASGVATFTGSSSAPIAINQVGLDYAMTPTGSGVLGTESGPFGIYQEGRVCPGGSCSVHGNSSDHKVDAVVSTTTESGTLLSVLVEDFDLQCAGYSPISSSVIIWKYTGTGSQTVVATLDKTLVHSTVDNGASHFEVCYQADNGKTFVDKFGNTVTTGLLPDCSATLTTNCIVSETAAKGGDRVVTFTVEDGKGRM